MELQWDQEGLSQAMAAEGPCRAAMVNFRPPKTGMHMPARASCHLHTQELRVYQHCAHVCDAQIPSRQCRLLGDLLSRSGCEGEP